MFSNLKPYDRYGAPAGQWIPAMPDHWRIAPGSGVLNPVTAKNTGLVESTVLSLSYGRVIVKPPEKLRGLVPESFETYQILEPGDIVVRPTDLQNDKTSLRVGHVRDRGIITSAYLGLRANGISNTYAFAYLAALDQMKIFYGMGSGLRQNLDLKDFKRLPVPVPPAHEQAAIVKYLGHAHARIDRAIASKRKLINLLEEQKQIIIHQAVTRGLDPSVPLKDSGVPWLGEIPAHWRMIPARHLYRAVNRRNRTGTEVKLSVTQARGLIPTDQMLESSMQASSFDTFQVCEIGDLVLNKYKAHLGVFWAARLRGLITPNYTVFAPAKGAVSEYYERLFHTPQYRAIFSSIVYGVTAGMSPLYNNDFNSLHCATPSVEEQLEIISFVEKVEREHADVPSRVLREIELLREFRTRLTSDIVTGQVDVRGAAATLSELPDEVLVSAADEFDDDELIDAELEFAGADE